MSMTEFVPRSVRSMLLAKVIMLLVPFRTKFALVSDTFTSSVSVWPASITILQLQFPLVAGVPEAPPDHVEVDEKFPDCTVLNVVWEKPVIEYTAMKVKSTKCFILFEYFCDDRITGKKQAFFQECGDK